MEHAIERYDDSWNRHDLDAIMTMHYACDGTHVFPFENGLILRKDVYSAGHRPRVMSE